MQRLMVVLVVASGLGCSAAVSPGRRVASIRPPTEQVPLQPDSERYEPPAIPSDSLCYELSLTEWSPPVDTSKFAWFLPPKDIALTHIPHPEGTDRSALRVLPDRDPADPERQMPFAMWWRSGTTIVIVWSDGFTAVGMKLTERGSQLEGTGRTSSDNLREQLHDFRVEGRRVKCALVGQSGAGARRRQHHQD
jgi:hypothetical protein